MSITINGATNTLTAASGLAIAGNTAVTGTLSASGTGSVGGSAVNFSSAQWQVKQTSETNAVKGIVVQRTSVDSTLGIGFNSSTGTWDWVPTYGATGAYADTRILHSDTEKVRVTSAGLAVTGTLSATGITSVTDVTDATSTTAASLKTAGGLAVAKTLYVGTGANIAGASTLSSCTISAKGNAGASAYTEIPSGAIQAMNIFSSSTVPKTKIYSATGATTNTGEFRIATCPDGVNLIDRLVVKDTGAVSISTGNIVFATAGAGIDFSATSDGSGTTTSEVLSDYEEGTWTPTQGGGLTVVGAFSSYGTYTKVGRQVTVVGNVAGVTSVAVNTGGIISAGLPFTVSAFGLGASANAANTLSGTVYVFTASVYSNAVISATPSISFTATYFV